MKRLIAVACATAAMLSFADETEYISPVTGKPIPKDGKYTLEQYTARDDRGLQKPGGFIPQKAERPPALVIHAREKPTLTVDEIGRVYKLGCHLDAIVLKEQRGNVAPLAFAQAKMASDKPLMVVVVVDQCADLPALSVYPEERIGIVNADRLQGGDDPVKAEVRIHKEVWRALGFVAGIGYAPYPNDVMQNVSTVQELDGLEYQVMQPMNFQKMYVALAKVGITRARRVPYRVACREGWAAPPTNDYQKAVWNEVHAIPDKPLTIEFDPKKDK